MFLYDEYDYLTYYDRLSSNNSARIRLWLYGRCLETVDENGKKDLAAPAAALASEVYSLTGGDCNDDDNHGGKRLLLYVVRVTHSEQKKKSRDDNQKWDFEKINPQQKVPALTITYKNGYVQSLYESSVILNYLEEFAYWYSQRHDNSNSKNNNNYYKTWETIQNNNNSMSSNNNFFSLTPMNSLELRCHMQLIIRTHDLYLSSPNCASQNDWSMATHTQGCMYLGRPPLTSTTTTTTEKPTLARYLTNDIRAKKLAELWHQLNVLESYLVETEKIIYQLHHHHHHQKQCVNNSDGTRKKEEEKDSAENYYDYDVGPFFCGNQISLADITIFPTFVYMNYLLPISIGWESAADDLENNKTSDNDFCCDYYCKSVFYARPRLKEWYKAMLKYVPCARRVQEELVDGLKKTRYDTGILQGIREEIEKDKHKYKWIYP